MIRKNGHMILRMAPAMLLLSKAAAPVVWVLERSGRVILWVLGQAGESQAKVTEEEVHTLLSEAHEEGLIEPEEREMMAGVMRLADRSARALMTPRHEVEMLELEATPAETVAAIRRVARPRMPVQSRESGEVVGIITLADAFNALSRREAVDPKKLLRDVPVVSDMADALDVMEILQGSDDHLALVYDEYGHFEGIITSGDILEAITGTVAGQTADEPALVEREDGSMLVSGWMPADEFCDRLGLPREMVGGYETVAGLVLNIFGRLPALGEAVEAEGVRVERVEFPIWSHSRAARAQSPYLIRGFNWNDATREEAQRHLAIVEEFYQTHMITGLPPAFDGGRSAARWLALQIGPLPKRRESAELSADLVEQVEAWRIHRARAATAKTEADRLAQEIMQTIGERRLYLARGRYVQVQTQKGSPFLAAHGFDKSSNEE